MRRVGVRLAHYDIRALGNAQSIWVVYDQMDRAYPDPTAGGARARWGASTVAGLLIEGDRADPRHQDSGIGQGAGEREVASASAVAKQRRNAHDYATCAVVAYLSRPQ